MSEYKNILEADGGANQIAVDRAISELRSGRPAIVRSGRNHVIVTGVETLDPKLAAKLDGLARGRARLVLPAPRVRRPPGANHPPPRSRAGEPRRPSQIQQGVPQPLTPLPR